MKKVRDLNIKEEIQIWGTPELLTQQEADEMMTGYISTVIDSADPVEGIKLLIRFMVQCTAMSAVSDLIHGLPEGCDIERLAETAERKAAVYSNNVNVALSNLNHFISENS